MIKGNGLVFPNNGEKQKLCGRRGNRRSTFAFLNIPNLLYGLRIRKLKYPRFYLFEPFCPCGYSDEMEIYSRLGSILCGEISALYKSYCMLPWEPFAFSFACHTSHTWKVGTHFYRDISYTKLHYFNWFFSVLDWLNIWGSTFHDWLFIKLRKPPIQMMLKLWSI